MTKRKSKALVPTVEILGQPPGGQLRSLQLRAHAVLDQRNIIEHLGEIADGSYMETRAIRVLEIDGHIVKELVQAPPSASVQVQAAVALLDRAAPKPSAGADEGDENVEWYVVLPKRARTTREWMKMHGLALPAGHKLKGDK
jgi:hypothetical protein